MNEETYTKIDIRKRLKQMRNKTGGDSRDLAVLSRMAYEFGVPEIMYSKRISDSEIVEITFKNQTNPSPLETEMENELRQYL